ncbi:MAG TPA: GNAT family N-acetyltransferase [Thermoclostridium sp.]
MQTKNLTIRKFCTEDFDDFAELIRDKMASEYAIYDYPFPTDDESLKKILDYFTGTDEFYAVELTGTNKVIGFLTLNNCGEEGVRNLGYCLHTLYQGKGYGTEAVSEIIRYAKEELKIKKLITGTAKNNIPSVRLLSKVGFKKIREDIASFAKDESGNTIDCITYSYEMLLT